MKQMQNINHFDVEAERRLKALSASSPGEKQKMSEEIVRYHDIKGHGSEGIEKALKLLSHAQFVDREPNYMTHAVRVGRFFIRFANPVSSEGTTLALLHNVLEVTGHRYQDIKDHFGDWVADGCRNLIVNRRRHRDDPQYLCEYYGLLRGQDPHVQQIKVLDKLDNILILFGQPSREIRQRYLDEVEEWLMPMVHAHLPILVGAFQELVAQTRTLPHKTLQAYLES